MYFSGADGAECFIGACFLSRNLQNFTLMTKINIDFRKVLMYNNFICNNLLEGKIFL